MEVLFAGLAGFAPDSCLGRETLENNVGVYVKLPLSSLWFPPMKTNKETRGKTGLAFCLIFIKLSTHVSYGSRVTF